MKPSRRSRVGIIIFAVAVASLAVTWATDTVMSNREQTRKDSNAGARLTNRMKGVRVDEFTTALTVAIVLGLLNFFVKPILVLFTLPVTFFTLGLFLLVINAIMILLCDEFVDGFEVSSFWTAMLFSIILSLSQSLVYQITGDTK